MDKIISVHDEGDVFSTNIFCSTGKILDVHEMIIIPGFIDKHMHFLGGGGKNGHTSRAGIVQFDDIIKFRVTTAISSLGIDSYLKKLNSLFARARELESCGLYINWWFSVTFEINF